MQLMIDVCIIIVEEILVNPWPLYGEKGLKVDFISEKKYSKKVAGVSLPKVWVNSTRWPNPKWPPTKRKQINCLAFNDPT